ncbi:MAG: hypothetical protein ACYCY5_00410, partial [Sulfuricella sp.]
MRYTPIKPFYKAKPCHKVAKLLAEDTRTPTASFIIDLKVKTTGFSRLALAELMLYNNSGKSGHSPKAPC